MENILLMRYQSKFWDREQYLGSIDERFRRPESTMDALLKLLTEIQKEIESVRKEFGEASTRTGSEEEGTGNDKDKFDEDPKKDDGNKSK